MTFGLDWVEGGNQWWPDKSAKGTCDSQLVKSSHKMLRLRKTKLLPQQVSDLGAFIFVVAMIPVRTTFKKIFIMFNDLFIKCLPPGDLSLGGDCCQSCSFPRPAAGEKEEGCSNLIVLPGSWLGPAHGLWPPGGRQYCWQLWRWEEADLDQKLHSIFVSCQNNGVWKVSGWWTPPQLT